MRSLSLALLVLALSGCDLFTSDSVVVRGTVTDTSTDQPLAGIGVALESGGSAGSTPTILDSSTTGADGRFELEITEGDCPQLLSGFGLSVTSPAANNYRYDEAFGAPNIKCEAGTQDIDVRLRPDA